MKIKHLLTYFLFCFLIALSGSVWAQIGDWRTLTSSGIIHRHECSFVEDGGKFYLVGGRTGGVDKYTNIYDPGTGLWTKGTHKPPIELHHFQAVALNGLVYITGAFTGGHPDETPVDKVYIYNPADDTWTAGAAIPEARRRGAAGAIVYNNKIYIVGGATLGHRGGNVAWLDEYDPSTGIWTALTDAPHARDHFQAAVAGNKLYLAGGRMSKYSGSSAADELVNEVDVYDFGTGNWETYPNNIPTGRAGTAAVVLNNELLVIGGEVSSQLPAHTLTEAMDLGNKNWRTLASLDTGRHGTHALVYDNKVYIVSGSKSRGGSGSSELNSMEEFSFLGISGTDDRNYFGSVTVYPNPVRSQVTIENIPGKLSWEIHSSCGIKMNEGKTGFNGDSEKIDLSNLTTGIYILTLKNKNEDAQKAFLLKKE